MSREAEPEFALEEEVDQVKPGLIPEESNARQGDDPPPEADRPSTRDWTRYDPERLAVYRLARAHTRAVAKLLREADTRGFADLVDQTRRSTASITGNTKEGYGEESVARKAQYYAYAKASTSETWAHIDNLVDFGCTTPEAIREIRDLQNQIIALLVTMIRNLETP